MKRREDRGTRMMENSLNRLNSFFTKANYTNQVRGYFVARTMVEKNEAINYFDTVLTEVSDRGARYAEPIRCKDGRDCFELNA